MLGRFLEAFSRDRNSDELLLTDSHSGPQI